MSTRVPGSVLLAFLVALTGCESADSAPTDDGPSTGANTELTVVVWSEHLKLAVPAKGKLVNLSDNSDQVIDTRGHPAEGASLTVPPGRYQITIEARYLESGVAQAVDGEDVFYVEPGASATRTVLVTDRKIGLLDPKHQLNSPEVSAPPLPLELAPG